MLRCFVLLLLLPPCYAYGFQSEFVINEILFAPENSELEFIELLNVSTQPQNLCQFSFSDNRDDIIPICQGVISISPGAYAVIARNGERLSTYFNGRAFVTPPTWPALNNSGDAVRLYRTNMLVDEVEYLSTWGQRGYSIERVDPSGPSWAAFNWQSSVSPFKSTPGERNSVFQPDQTPPGILLAEKQPSAQVLVIFDEPVDTAAFSTDQFRIRNIRPAQVIALTDASILLSFASEPSGDFLVTRDIQDYSNNLSPTQSTPLSYIPEPGDLVINELMYEPLADEFDAFLNQPEYVEILNVSEKHLSLRHLSLVGPEDETGNADSLKGTSLHPVIAQHQFGLLYTDSPPNQLTQAFPSLSSYSNSATLIPISKSSLNLLNGGDTVRIVVQDSTIDQVSYEPGWHYPDLISTRGISLERRTANASSTSSLNWSSSVHPEGGTPGYANSIHVQEAEQTDSSIAEISPIPFTPNGDGIQDVLSITIRPERAPQSITVRIFDSKGRLVRTLVPASLVGQKATFLWDGASDDNQSLPTGMYILFIELQNLLYNEVQKLKKIAVLAHP